MNGLAFRPKQLGTVATFGGNDRSIKRFTLDPLRRVRFGLVVVPGIAVKSRAVSEGSTINGTLPKKVARTIREHLANVVSFCTHGITNAVAEGINSKIQSIKRRVGRFRNRENYKYAIYFYCGGLDLHPL